MSHFTTVETQFKDIACLAEALKKLGFEVETRKFNLLHVKNYSGDPDPQKCCIRAWRRTQDRQLSGYSELGFFWDANKKLGMRADHMDTGVSHDGKTQNLEYAKPWCKGLKKAYAYEEVMATIRQKGYAIKEENTDQQQHVHITIQRSF